MRDRTRTRGGDDGSALVVALVVLTVIGLTVSSMLGLADATLRSSSRSLRPGRKALFAADGALDTAIRRIVNSQSIAKYGSSDCGLTIPADAGVGTPEVDVACVPQSGSRVDVTVPPGQAEFPSQAILTLGRRATWPGNGDRSSPYNWNTTSGAQSSDPSYGIEPGILFRPQSLGSASSMSFAGDMVSNSTITAEGVSVSDLSGRIVARGACSAAVTTLSGTKTCSLGYSGSLIGADPLYPHRGQTEAFPALRSVSSQCTSSTLQTFDPGFYNDAAALSALFQDPSCSGKDFWFRPGLYYLDFRNTSTPPACATSGSPVNQVHQWCIDSASHTSATRPHVMGGTPKSGWSSTGTQSVVSFFNPLDAGVASSPAGLWSNVPNGPKVIDGSSASTSWGATSLTTPSTATGSPSGVWTNLPAGARTIGDSSTGSSSWSAISRSALPAAATESCGTGCTNFGTLSGARDIGDGSLASGSLTGVGTLHAVTTTYATSIPSTATITRVTATVSQRRTGSSTGVAASTLEIVNGEGTSCGTVSVGTPNGSLTSTTTASLFTTCLNTPARVNGLKAHYRANKTSGSSSSTFDLDGVEINVTATDTGSRSLTMTDYDATTIPSDAATINTASLVVATAATNATRTVTLYNGSGTSCGTTTLTTATQTIAVSSACISTRAQLVGARAVVTIAPTSGTGSATVDGTRLDVTYTPTARTITLSGLQGSPNAVPSTATSIDTAELDVTATAAGSTGRVSVYPGGGGAACGTWTLPVTTITGLASCMSTVTKANGAYVTYSATPSATTGSGTLDGVRLRVTYTDSPARFDFPGMCDSTGPGVQFVFGGDSHLYVPNGTFELCAGPAPSGSLTNQQIAMYGLRPVTPLAPSSTTVSTGWSGASNAYSVGESPTVLDSTTSFAAVTGGNAADVSQPRPLTLSGFGGGVSIPSGAAVKKVYAMVSHGQSPSGQVAPRLKVWNGAGTLCSETPGEGYELNLHNEDPGAFTRRYEAVDLTTCFADADPNVAAARLNGAGLTVELDAKPTTGSFLGAPGTYWQLATTSRLDGVQLVVELQATTASSSSYIPQNGCVSGLASYPEYWDGYGDPDCAFLKWDGTGASTSAARGQLSIHGTVYAPGGAIDVYDLGSPCADAGSCTLGTLVGVDYSVADRGIIARHVRFKGFAVKSGYTGAVFSCGECGPTVTNPADVILRAQVDGRTTVEARVQVPNPLAEPGASPDVSQWVVDP